MLVEMKDICKDYPQGRETVRVLKNINLQVKEGDYLAIMGPSGSGKTTLMNLIGCLDVPTSGEYLLAGKNLHGVFAASLAQQHLRAAFARELQTKRADVRADAAVRHGRFAGAGAGGKLPAGKGRRHRIGVGRVLHLCGKAVLTLHLQVFDFAVAQQLTGISIGAFVARNFFELLWRHDTTPKVDVLRTRRG